MNVSKQLERMRKRLEQSKAAQIRVTFANGEVVTTDAVGAITLLRDSGVGKVVGVTTDRADYMGLAGCLDALCRPAHNRKVEDFE
ncbi:MAG: hypothetical protein HFF26_02925 [Oscillospiraceae bacterium]|nr:hypothetical protein [Oscillospiraceae bacterium]